MTCYGVDMFGFYLYETTKITNFTDFHPTHNTQGFFFTVLLRNFTFRDERKLLSERNTNKNYLLECYIRGLLPDVQAMQNYLSQYAHRNLIETEKHAQLLDRLLQDYPFLDPLNFSNNENIPHELTPSLYRLSTPNDHVFYIQLSDMMLTPDQQHIFHVILQNPTGLHVLTGTPGNKKKLLNIWLNTFKHKTNLCCYLLQQALQL